MQALAAFDKTLYLFTFAEHHYDHMEGSPGLNLPEVQKNNVFLSNTYCSSSKLAFQNKQRWRKEQTSKEKDLRGDASLQHSGPPRPHSHVSDVKKLDGKIKVDICRHRQWCKFGVLESSSRIKVLWNLFYINHYLTVIFVFLSLLAWWFISMNNCPWKPLHCPDSTFRCLCPVYRWVKLFSQKLRQCKFG